MLPALTSTLIRLVGSVGGRSGCSSTSAGSRILYRKETQRLRDKAAAAQYLKDLDPRPDKAPICCGLIVTDKTMPAKPVLRSGWNPGDVFALVDLFPRHDPLNVPGIVGMSEPAHPAAGPAGLLCPAAWLPAAGDRPHRGGPAGGGRARA
jgi:hypothetical protein